MMQEQPHGAEFYAAEAMAADRDEWIEYNGRSNEESLDEWLERYKPSQISRDDGVGWICVRLPRLRVSVVEGDLIGLKEAWEQLQASGRPINYQTITELAKSHGINGGKWTMYVDSGGKVDYLWRLVAYGVMEGHLGHVAKVNPYDETSDFCKHVICIYNDNFTDEEQVLQLENSIRNSCGIKCPMKYKPDVYTHLGVYRNNKWGLKPTVYESVYDICKGVSHVKSTIHIELEDMEM